MKMTSKIRIAVLLASVLMIMAAVLVCRNAGMELPGEKTVYADEEEYTYTVTIHSGKEGYFGTKGNTVKKLTGFKYGDTCTIDAGELDLKIKDSDKYYVRGLKLSGHDNDEIAGAYYQTYTFEVKEDLDFSAAYGMKGGMVEYTVNYVDEDGKKLRDTDTYYGMPGDKPVVSYKHIKGYVPDHNNVMKTLTENEEDNHFVFTYRSNVIEEEGSGDEEGENGGEGGNDAGDADGNGGRTAGAAAGRIFYGGDDSDGGDGGNTGDVTDLDGDKEPPKAAGDKAGQDGGAGPNAGVVAGVAGFAVLTVLLFLIFRRKKGSAA